MKSESNLLSLAHLSINNPILDMISFCLVSRLKAFGTLWSHLRVEKCEIFWRNRHKTMKSFRPMFDKLLKMFKPLKMKIFNGFNFSICLITKF